jgi:hypothetical protein
MNLEDAEERLQEMSHVTDIISQDNYTSITAIDFKLYELSRQTNSSNFVFGRFGSRFKGGLIRLPRIFKQDAEPVEMESYLESFVPPYLVSEVDIRLEPEIDLDDSYFYLHIETPEDDLEGTLQLVENLQEYDTDKFN